MKLSWLIPLITSTLLGQVTLDRGTDRIRIEVGGQIFSDFFLGQNAGKPYLAPLRTVNGEIVTRQFPMERVDGESRDHPHQRGLFFAFENVNGTDFWNNELTYTSKNRGRIVLDKVLKVESGKQSGSLRVLFRWNDPQGKRLLSEDRTMTFYDDPVNRIIDVDLTLTAGEERAVFGDAKDGAFAVRLADALREDKGHGQMVNAEGKHGEAEVWGRRSNWVDYACIAIFDHPENPGHPPRWHSRAYGLFAVNPFGNRVFDKNAPEQTTVIEPGKSLRYRWRVLIHPPGVDIASLYAKY